ncbi:hemerythrin domain-containing protein [Streptomyces sp. NPDC088124]|uniref:hemerythrin domain-containing protein n=1 Tax=Streptomyces sp. NPDC088124 TaxID=3154654 RepID=UPI00343D32C7
MAVSPALRAERSRIHDELLAEHTLMRRGAALVTASFSALADGRPVDVRTLVGTSRWLLEFVRGQRASEVELLWPVLRGLFPGPVAELTGKVAQREALEAELHTLARAVDTISAREVTGGSGEVLVVVGEAAMTGLPSAIRIQSILNRNLDEEEPLLLDLFPRVPDRDVARLRSAIVHGAPRTGPHLVFGLLEDPDRVPGHTALLGNFPASVRWLRRVFLTRYRSTKRALGVPSL